MINTSTIKYSRNMAPSFFEGASREDLKWTINYLISLLEVPEGDSNNSKKAISVSEAKMILRQHKLQNKGVPAEFNGMRDDVNPKYL